MRISVNSYRKGSQSAEEYLRRQRDPARAVPRLVEEQGKHRLTVGIEREGDQAVEHKGETVLLIDPDTRTQLESLVLDLRDTPQGSRLAFVPKEEGN